MRLNDATSIVSLIVFTLGVLLIACSTSTTPGPENAQPNQSASAESTVATAPGSLPLRVLADVPLSGSTNRFDYQSFDSTTGRLYIAHLGSDLMTVFDVNKQTIVGDVKDLKRVHGVFAVPALHRVYASATGANELAVIDDQSL
ncbi:MAG TPA: hypothetical protein VJW17_12065, partial [Pyrinomonadaceae bacterium]|nr:hypothetical protein [Pyrinomonadaceae bacterium]